MVLHEACLESGSLHEGRLHIGSQTGIGLYNLGINEISPCTPPFASSGTCGEHTDSRVGVRACCRLLLLA